MVVMTVITEGLLEISKILILRILVFLCVITIKLTAIRKQIRDNADIRNQNIMLLILL